MMKANTYEMIGNTPLKTVKYGRSCIAFKLEQYNFLGSIKTRTAYYLVQSIIANKKKEHSGMTKICESTSGNLGIALDYFCKKENMEFLCLTDKSISANKIKKLMLHNVDFELITAPSESEYREARIKRAEELQKQGYIWTNQYDNDVAILAHYETTGPEIYQQTKGKVTHLVCAMGTGGTIIGIGKYLKEKNADIQVIGVEPYGSTIFSEDEGVYITAGAGMKGTPGNIRKNPKIIDAYDVVNDKVSIVCCNELYNKYQLDVGITSGMAFFVAKKVALEYPNSYVVVVCPDGRSSYEEYL